jgi:adenylate kinase
MTSEVVLRIANLVTVKIFTNTAIVPNELIIDLVKTRLEKPDCKINGWILDGCPTTSEQIASLNEHGILPTLVITLDQSDSSVYEKIEQRRFDPVDCRHYNLLSDDVPKEAQDRLIHERENTHPHVKRRLQEYRNFLATVENEYRKHLIRINAEESENDAS